VLHNQVGFALRGARPWAAQAPGWNEGARLMTGLLEWTKRWDAGFLPSTTGALVKLDVVTQSRCLRKHVSDVSTVVPEAGIKEDDEDDGTESLTSISSTATWGVDSSGQSQLGQARSGRKSRYRPHRRAKRRERLLERDVLKERMFRQSLEEVQLENGPLPFSMMHGIAEDLMTIVESDGDDWFKMWCLESEGTVCSEPCCDEKEDKEEDSWQGAQHGHTAANLSASPHQTPPAPASGTGGRKRKQMETEFQDRQAADSECTSVASSHLGCTGYTSQAATAAESYGPMEAAMKNMLQALQAQVLHLGDLRELVHNLGLAAEALLASLAVKPRYGLTEYAKVLDLVRSQLTHRTECSELSVSPGPLEWLPQLQGIIQGWDGLSREDQEMEVDDINGEMEMHCAVIQYCLDEFEGLMELELESEALSNAQYLRAPQNRLDASLAGR